MGEVLETLVKDKDGKQYASAFPAGTVRAVTFHADGRITEKAAPPEMMAAAGLDGAKGKKAKAKGDAPPVDDAAPVSAGRALLQRLGVGAKPRTVPVELDGQTVYIKRLDAVGINQIGAMSARNRDGSLDFAQDDDLRGFMRAVIFVCTTSDAGGYLQVFDAVEAWDLVAAVEDDARRLATRLFECALETNPDLLGSPDNSATAKEQSEKKEIAPSTGSAPESTSA